MALLPHDNELDLTIVVSCYNEENYIVETLDNVVGALEEAGCSYEVIVMDDVSKDNSVIRVKEYLEKHPGIHVHLHANSRNRGLANNYVEAAFLGRGKYFRLCCGDNAEPKPVLLEVFKHVGKADVVIPYQNQNEVEGKPLFRKMLSRTFTFLVNTISGYNVKYYNGLALHLRYNVLRWHPSSYGFGFQADMVTRVLDEGASYLQIPSTSVDQKGSASSALTMRNLLSVGHTLLEIAFRRIRRALYGHGMQKPIEIFLDERESGLR